MRFVIILALIGVACAYTVSYEGYKVYRVTPIVRSQVIELLKLEIQGRYDFWTPVRIVGYPCDIMVSPEDQPEFEKFLIDGAYKWHVTIENVQELIDGQRKLKHKLINL